MAHTIKKKKSSLKLKKLPPRLKAKKVAKKASNKSKIKVSAKKPTQKAIKKLSKKVVSPKVIAKKVAAKKAVIQVKLTLKKPKSVKVTRAIAHESHVEDTVVSVPSKPTAPAQSELSVGNKAPFFSMPTTQNGLVSSDTLKGKIYVLYFYPKDDTSGCTAEACEFRNTLPQFGQLGVTIIGVSKDSLESHEKFSRKYNLPFALASDQNSTVCESFGTWVSKSMYGRTYMGIERSTFLIDGEGTLRALWRKVSVPGHVEEVKKAVENL